MWSGLGFVVAAALLLCFSNSAYAAEAVDWWEAATFYQVYPWSFQYSDGDGVGDLNGISSRLKYLRDLGVTAVWLSPIYPSPMVDMGYDVSNFTDIEPRFGTLADFDNLVKTAHKLGLKIIWDIIPNHSSDQCEWFQKSVRREAGYEDFYVWFDAKIDEKTGERLPPSNWMSRFNGSAWAWNEERQQYYYHQFFPQQPDFNLTNTKVRRKYIEILEFWLDRGVDAFRVDAVPYYVETYFENGTVPHEDPVKREHTYSKPEDTDILYEWREFLDAYQKKNGGITRMMLAESYAPIRSISNYIDDGILKGSQMPMHLNIVKVKADINATVLEMRARYWMDVIWKEHRMANWVIGNHDNSRVASRMGYNRKDLMAILIHSMPGATVTSQQTRKLMSWFETGGEYKIKNIAVKGEEIGEIDCAVRKCDFRDPERTPMQWDTSKNAGFSTGNTTWLPVNANHKFLNVETERRTNHSSFKIFKEMIKLKQTPAFKAFKEDGAFEYYAYNDEVFHIMRTDGTEEYRILANFGNNLEHVDGLTNKVMEYVVLNSYSPHNKGDTVDLSKGIYLMPSEAVVLRSTAKT